MRHMPLTLACGVGGLVAAGLALLAGAPSAAQTAEEITVLGQIGPDNQPRSLSYPVSYRDLDLRTKTGRDQLSSRIELTATYLCEKLGEGASTGAGVIPSCRSAAISRAMTQVNAAQQQALASTAPFTPGASWTPPGAK